MEDGEHELPNYEILRHQIEQKDRIVEQKDALIERLRHEIRELIEEKEEMIDNFRVSTNILIEKIKDLESQKTGYRPQTANILAKPKGDVKVRTIEGRRPLARVINSNVELQAEWEREIPEDPGNEGEERKATERKKCTNCQRNIAEDDFEAHTITCFRNVTKCKICADYIPSNAKLTHLTEWRSPAKVLSFIESGDAEKLKLCFQHGADINAKIPEEGNAIARKGNEDMFTVLMGFGIDMEMKDDEGNTPILVAAQQDDMAIMKSIVELGGSVDVKNKICWTPLFYACKRGDKALVEFLLASGANPSDTTPLGDNALKIAQKYGHQEIALMMVNKGLSLRSTGSKGLARVLTRPLSGKSTNQSLAELK